MRAAIVNINENEGGMLGNFAEDRGDPDDILKSRRKFVNMLDMFWDFVELFI